MKKILVAFASLAIISGCAQGVDAVERLGTCVIDGNQNNNCEISTLEGNTEKATEVK